MLMSIFVLVVLIKLLSKFLTKEIKTPSDETDDGHAHFRTVSFSVESLRRNSTMTNFFFFFFKTSYFLKINKRVNVE